MIEGNKIFLEHAFNSGYERGKQKAAIEILQILLDNTEFLIDNENNLYFSDNINIKVIDVIRKVYDIKLDMNEYIQPNKKKSE